MHSNCRYSLIQVTSQAIVVQGGEYTVIKLNKRTTRIQNTSITTVTLS